MTAILLILASLLIFGLLRKIDKADFVSESCLRRVKAHPTNDPPEAPKFDETSTKVKK